MWTKNICILAIILGSLPAFSDTITATITFPKRPPKVGLLYISDDKSGANAKGPTIDQQNKEFISPLFVGPKDSEITFQNSDDISHNVYADDRENGVKFDLGISEASSKFSRKVKISWDEGKIVKVACKIHPRMHTWVASLSTSHYQVVKFDRKKKGASFEVKLKDVPSTLEKISLWLPKFESQSIAVKTGETKVADLIRKGKVKGSIKIVRTPGNAGG